MRYIAPRDEEEELLAGIQIVIRAEVSAEAGKMSQEEIVIINQA